jgi:hypothetical protein
VRILTTPEKPFAAYGSRASALRAIKRLGNLPGFKKSPKLRDHETEHGDGFNINRIRLGDDSWSDGFRL